MSREIGSSRPTDVSIPVAPRSTATRPDDERGMADASKAAEDAVRLGKQAVEEIERSRMRMRRSVERISAAAEDAIESSEAIERSRRKIAQTEETIEAVPTKRRKATDAGQGVAFDRIARAHGAAGEQGAFGDAACKPAKPTAG